MKGKVTNHRYDNTCKTRSGVKSRCFNCLPVNAKNALANAQATPLVLLLKSHHH